MQKYLIRLLILPLFSLFFVHGCDSAPSDTPEITNPSDITENISETETVDLYFLQVTDGIESITPVEREISAEKCIIESTLLALLNGTTDDEKERGFSSSIPAETELLSFGIHDQAALCNFSRAIEPGGGSAWVTAIREQITKTLEQFDDVDKVVIMVESKREDVLQP